MKKKSAAAKTLHNVGGLAARANRGPLYVFTEKNDGSFVAPDADYISRLYFPLFNMHGMKCSITPDFKGDICSSFNSYYTIPVVGEDLHRVNNSRNFWVHVPGHRPWSATGASAFNGAHKWQPKESACVEAGIGWFSTTRINKHLGLSVKSTAFVPMANEYVELCMFEIENISKKLVRFTPTYATPIFGRTADNLRDHRHVTTMFNEIDTHENGVIVKARIHHDETGHTPNKTNYIGLGFGERGTAPKHVWARMQDFIGEGGSMLNPEAVFKAVTPPASAKNASGSEAVCAVQFSPVSLKAGAKARFVVLHGITDNRSDIGTWSRRYGTWQKAAVALDKTKAAWKQLSDSVYFDTENKTFDNWMRWVVYQTFVRKVYGNSYLLDLGYGRGGRGWRDLWSDLLGLFLVDPQNTRTDIINNLLGVRIDGSNATIIGTKPGEFKADRNNIVRTWCDHGTWPLFVLDFYIQQTGDIYILNKEITYWKDALIHRSKKRDEKFEDSQGNSQRDKGGKVYKGSILEHVILQQFSTFFNVGKHNNILLEGADWNDTYDMARNKGESVCFYNWYAGNLLQLANLLEELDRRGQKNVTLLKEISALLDRMPGQSRVNYASPSAKNRRLAQYFDSVAHSVSGKKAKISCTVLAADLRAKAEHAIAHIRKNEWVRTKHGQQYFNGHYDDHARRVDGNHRLGTRMDLTSQVLPVMCDVASDEQIPQIVKAMKRYLAHPTLKGLRLCTDFKELKLDFGRATGFVYGHRENGSVWNQMNVQMAYALYKRGFVKEAYEVFGNTFRLCTTSQQSRVFPNMPSNFLPDGRGSYSYVTGSSAWLILAMVCEMFGVRGKLGDLVLNPKLVREQFGTSGKASVVCNLHSKKLRVTYINKKKLEWNRYKIARIAINGKPAAATVEPKKPYAVISKRALIKACTKKTNAIEVALA